MTSCDRKIAIESNTAQIERPQEIAASLGVNTEELAQAVVDFLVNARADDCEAAAPRRINRGKSSLLTENIRMQGIDFAEQALQLGARKAAPG